MKNTIIFVLLLFTVGCSSIKKVKKTSVVNKEEITIKEDTKKYSTEDMKSFTFDKTVTEDLFSITVSEVKETKTTIDSAGIKIVVPETITKTTTYLKTTKLNTETSDSSKVIKNDSIFVSKDSVNLTSNIFNEDLDKESEGINVIEEIVSGLVGGSLGFGKYIILVIIIISLSLTVWKKYKNININKKENEKTN